MQDLDHKHLLVTALFTEAPKDIDYLTGWVKRLVENVNMKILVQPNLVYCDTPGNEGITGTTVIETSHCAFHIWDGGNPPIMQFDLYSCKRFDPNVVIDMFKELGAVTTYFTLVDRNSKHFVSTQGEVKFVSLTDLLEVEDKIHFTTGFKKLSKDRTPDERRVVSNYNKLVKRFSFKYREARVKYTNNFSTAIWRIKTRCEQKNLDFDLTTEWCEQAFAAAKQKWPKLTLVGDDADSFWFANIDRINPAEGYVQSNCQYLPRALNVAKWKWSAEEIKILKEIIKDL